MSVCPVCFSDNSQDDKVCSECGADLSESPDKELNSLDSTTSPFILSSSPVKTAEAKPLRCNACGSDNFASARICEKCSQSLYSTAIPQKKKGTLIVFLVIIAIVVSVFLFKIAFFAFSFSYREDMSVLGSKLSSQTTYYSETEESLPEAEYREAIYEDYADVPDGVFGDNIKITGTVAKIESDPENDSRFLSIYIYEDFDTLRIWLVDYELKENENIEVGDILTFYGKSQGLVNHHFVDTGATISLPLVRASFFKDRDVISGKTWSIKGDTILELREDGTCTVVFEKGEEGEVTDTGKYDVYHGRDAKTYITSGINFTFYNEEELLSKFDLSDSLDDFYCLVLYSDKSVQEGESFMDDLTLLYFGLYSEETGELSMIDSTTVSLVTIKEVTE